MTGQQTGWEEFSQPTPCPVIAVQGYASVIANRPTSARPMMVATAGRLPASYPTTGDATLIC